jgi:transposase
MRRKGKQRTDSTHILGLVADLNRLELVWESLRVGLWALEKEDGAWVEQQVPASFMEEHGIKRSDYRMSEAEMQTLLRRTGADGWWLLQQLARAPQNLRDLGEVQTLRTVWQQQFEVDEDDHYQGPRKSMKGSELIQNPHDPEVQYSEKRGKGWKGYRAQVSETAEAKGDINFITDVAVTKAQLQDVSALPEIQARLAGRNLTPNEQVVDQAYVSTQMLAMSDEQGIRLVGPLPTQPTTGLFQIPDFQIDLEQRVAICPAGCRSQSAILSKRVDRGLEYVFAFGKQCATCSLRQRCTTARNGRTLRYHSQHCFLENRQAEMQTEAFWEEMKARPPIEGTLSQLVRQGGRRARYRGLRRVNLQWILTAMAVNLKRLRRAWATNYQPSWAVALLD